MQQEEVAKWDSGSSRAKAAEREAKEACISRKRRQNISNKRLAAAAVEQQEEEAKM